MPTNAAEVTIPDGFRRPVQVMLVTFALVPVNDVHIMVALVVMPAREARERAYRGDGRLIGCDERAHEAHG